MGIYLIDSYVFKKVKHIDCRTQFDVRINAGEALDNLSAFIRHKKKSQWFCIVQYIVLIAHHIKQQ
jgi:hypothetical protein